MTVSQSIIHEDVKRALLEDGAKNDLTGELINKDTHGVAVLIARQSFILCGFEWFEQSFRQLDSEVTFQWFAKDGEGIKEKQTICEVKGNLRALLAAERTALNFLQMMSAVATKTFKFTKKICPPAKLLDTRKTLPGLRFAQKYAVKCGGGVNHRFGLYDAILIKENHIVACGSISKAIQHAKKIHPNKKIEVEVENFHELEEAFVMKPNVVMLDNFTLDELREAVSSRKDRTIMLEASGNIILDTIADVSATGVDYVSSGDITKSISAVDLSFLVSKKL